MNTILSFIFALELGFVPVNTMIDYINDDSFKGYVTLEAGFRIIDIIYINTETHIFIEASGSSYNFYPHQANFIFDAGVNLSDNINIGFRTRCFHPILNSNKIPSGYFGGGNEFYFRIKGEIPILK